MTGLEPPEKARSQDAGAFVSADDFRAESIDPSEYQKYLLADGDDNYRVKISPAAFDYLRMLPTQARGREVVRALKFARLNGRPRVWSTDFALAGGCVTLDDVIAWHAGRGIKVRSSSFGGLSRG